MRRYMVDSHFDLDNDAIQSSGSSCMEKDQFLAKTKKVLMELPTKNEVEQPTQFRIKPVSFHLYFCFKL